MIHLNQFTLIGLFYHNSLGWSISNGRLSTSFIEIPVFNTNSADHEMPCSASDLGLHSLTITLLGVSRLKQVKLKQNIGQGIRNKYNNDRFGIFILKTLFHNCSKHDMRYETRSLDKAAFKPRKIFFFYFPIKMIR